MPSIYNRFLMIAEHTAIEEDEEVHESIRRKIRLGNNSGYLDEEYETTQQFPVISEYHFRIEDEHEILALQRLHKESQPIAIENSFANSSNEFKTRMDSLLNGLNFIETKFINSYAPETHGFYTLADSYDDDAAIQNVLDKANLEQVRQKIEAISMKDHEKPTFIRRPKKIVAESEKEQIKQLSKNLKRMTFNEQDL